MSNDRAPRDASDEDDLAAVVVALEVLLGSGAVQPTPDVTPAWRFSARRPGPRARGE